jgi:hypothetical protein
MTTTQELDAKCAAMVAEITFVMRKVPKGIYAGQLCAELRALPGVPIIRTLKQYGLDEKITEMERYTARGRGGVEIWKMMRIYPDSEVCRELYELCSQPEFDDVETTRAWQRETEQWLAHVSMLDAADELCDTHQRQQLVQMAEHLQHEYELEPLYTKKSTKREIAEAIASLAEVA